MHTCDPFRSKCQRGLCTMRPCFHLNPSTTLSLNEFPHLPHHFTFTAGLHLQPHARLRIYLNRRKEEEAKNNSLLTTRLFSNKLSSSSNSNSYWTSLFKHIANFAVFVLLVIFKRMLELLELVVLATWAHSITSNDTSTVQTQYLFNKLWAGDRVLLFSIRTFLDEKNKWILYCC